jgi:O-antigen/teichoic acid export membrane protein
MAQGAFRLLKKGLLDTLLQVAATTGVRFLLVAAIFVLSGFVSDAEIASYDLFVVASSILLILLTLGLDSGLATVAAIDDAGEQLAYLWVSLALCLLLTTALYLPLRFGSGALGLASLFDVRVFTAAYGYAAANAVMTLLFSYNRWLGKAVSASIIILVSNLISFAAAGIAFAAYGSVTAFIHGLLAGSVVGIGLVLVYLSVTAPIPDSIRQAAYFKRVAVDLVRLSWPFGVASFALIARRAIDRALILAIGLSGLLGAYALVSRTGEVAAFFCALPAMGLAPIVVREYDSAGGQRVARILYMGYLALTALILGCAAALWFHYGASLFPENARSAATVFLAMLAANLFFTETTVAGFGFIIVQRTWLVAALSLLFILVNLAVAVPLAWLGQGLEAVAAGYLLASLAHSSLMIYLSERKVKFGYPLMLINMVKLMITLGLLYMMFGG